MGDLVDELLKRHVTPVLRDAGFRRSGAAYRLFAANGDCAIGNVRRWTTDPAIDGFQMFLSVAPLPYVEWLNRKRASVKPPGQEHALLQWTLRAPVEWQLTPRADTTVWRLASSADVDTCGEIIAAMLTEDVPWLVSLFDHDRLCATIQDRYGDFYILPERHIAQAIVRSAAGPAEEVDRLLAAAQLPVNSELSAWILARG